MKWAMEFFGVGMHATTAGNYLRQGGFRKKKMVKNANGYKLSRKQLVLEAWNWVVDMRKEGNFRLSLSSICSIDFTLTSHRTDAPMSYAGIGSTPPILGAGISSYTNCIITCIWADGVNRTPCMMFTTNPTFQTGRNPTKRRDALVAHLKEMQELYGIASSRIKWLPKTAKRKYMVPEAAYLVRIFFEHYGVPPRCFIFSDGGNSFKEKETDVLLSLGFEKHYKYPSASHPFLSPNDNDLHGAAKVPWRLNVRDFSDDVMATLCLMNYLDHETEEHSSKNFQRNMLSLKEEDVPALVKAVGKTNSGYHQECLRAFRIFKGEDARGSQEHTPKELRDGLDGSYYE